VLTFIVKVRVKCMNIILWKMLTSVSGTLVKDIYYNNNVILGIV
jgi:hypothetical protein